MKGKHKRNTSKVGLLMGNNTGREDENGIEMSHDDPRDNN